MPTTKLKDELNKFSWDSENPLIVFKKEHLLQIINKLQKNKITLSELIEWANLLEVREDIEYEKPYDAQINKIIFTMANPELVSNDLNVFKDFIINLINKSIKNKSPHTKNPNQNGENNHEERRPEGTVKLKLE
jgi:hypothetical protein